MRRMRHAWVATLSLTALMAFSACGSYGEVRSETRIVESDGADEVQATFDLNSGTLNITGGATSMMNAELTYNEKLKPEITYRVTNGRGQLKVDQPSTSFSWGTTRNSWDIQLTDDLPFEIIVDVSSGDSLLDLDTLKISRLEVDSSSGGVDVTLADEQPSLGLVNLDSSSGDVRLDLSGSYQQLSAFKVETSSGDIELNLVGDFQRNVTGEIDASSGDVTVAVPANIGVIISADTSAGEIRADGFKINGDAYVNDAYGTAAVTITLEIDVSSGDVTLALAK